MAAKKTSKRPPKSWIRRCASHVKAAARRAHRRIRTTPEAVCGGAWYHKMSPEARASAKRKYPN